MSKTSRFKLTDASSLKHLYLREKLSLRQIGRRLGCGHRTVRLALIRFGIPIRSREEGIKNRYISPYSEVIYTEEEKKLLAMAIDLEGAIYIAKRKRHYKPGVSISNISRALLEHIYRLSRIGTICSYPRKHYRRVWMWTVASTIQVENILKEILPYLIAKKEQGKLLLGFCQYRIQNFGSQPTEKEHNFYVEMKALNKRGRVENDGL